MQLIPAIDLKNGSCVRLLQGEFDKETVYSNDPVAMAVKFEEAGAKRLHLVDLDGAFQGEGANISSIRSILKNVSIPKGLPIENVDLEKAKYLCSLPKVLGKHPDLNDDITINIGRFGPYLKCSNKSARIETVDELIAVEGAVISIDVVVSEVMDAVVVPIAAVLTEGSDEKVRIVTKDGKIERRVIETGMLDGAWVEVVAGVSPGEFVILEIDRS